MIFKAFPESFQSWFIKELYNLNLFNKMELLCNKVQHKKSSNYYMGLYAEKNGHHKDAVKFFKKFISIYKKENYKICHLSSENCLIHAERKVYELSNLSFKFIYQQRKRQRDDANLFKLLFISLRDCIINNYHKRSVK